MTNTKYGPQVSQLLYQGLGTEQRNHDDECDAPDDDLEQELWIRSLALPVTLNSVGT
jgi:hypothetical protein